MKKPQKEKKGRGQPTKTGGKANKKATEHSRARTSNAPALPGPLPLGVSLRPTPGRTVTSTDAPSIQMISNAIELRVRKCIAPTSEDYA